MKTVAILVHGYNVSYPERTVGKLRSHFEALGCMVEMFTYGDTNLFQVRWRNPRLAKKLARRVKHWKDLGYKVILVGHSNGCAIIYLTTTVLGVHSDQVVAINPALKKHYNPDFSAKVVQVWHNSGDKPVVFAKFWSKIIPDKWFRARPWGEMGNVGYVGSNHNVVNIDTGLKFLPNKALGHSAVFHKPESKFFLPLIAEYAVNKVARLG